MIHHILNILKIIFGFSLLGTAIAFFPTESFETKETVISIMKDVTEKHSSQIDPLSIHTQLDLKEHKHDGYTFRFVDLSDVSLNPVTEIILNASPILLSNEMSRDKEIKQMEDSITKELRQSDTSGRSHSSIYIPVAKELTILSVSTADTKILVVYSDLMENTPQLSLYDKNTHFNSVEIKKLFNESFPLPDLKGIEVYLVYQPRSPESDNTYKLISQVYNELLTDKGANVYIQANFIKIK